MNKQYLKQFAIIMDSGEKKVNRNFFQKLIDSVSDKLCGKKRPDVQKKLHNLLIECDFDCHDRILCDEDLNFRSPLFRCGSDEFIAETNKYLLMRDFDKLVKLLKEYLGDEPKRKSKEYEIEVTIERPKAKKLRKVTTYDKITILERWVKIGYKMYRRQFDSWSGDEYIVVDGDVYEIKHDRYGREYLA